MRGGGYVFAGLFVHNVVFEVDGGGVEEAVDAGEPDGGAVCLGCISKRSFQMHPSFKIMKGIWVRGKGNIHSYT